MKTWSEVASSEGFKALDPTQQEEARNQYFDKVVTPRAPKNDLEEVRRQFDAVTAPTIKAQDNPIPGVSPEDQSKYSLGKPPVEESINEGAAFGGMHIKKATPLVEAKEDPKGLLSDTKLSPNAEPATGRSLSESLSGADVSQVPKIDTSKMSTAEDRAVADFGISPDMSFGEKALRSAKGSLKDASNALEQKWLGGARLIADITGVNKENLSGISAQFNKENDAVAKTYEADYGLKMAKNIGASVVQNLPTMGVGLYAGTSAALTTMFGDSFLQTYDDSRNSGLGVGASTARSALFGTAEVIGESIGLPHLLKSAREALKGVPTAQLAHDMARYIVAEIPGEQLTYVSQFLTDKGFGLNPQAGMKEFLQGVQDTAIATIGQTAIMGGSAFTANKIMRDLNKNHSKGEEGISQSANMMKQAGFEFDPSKAWKPSVTSADLSTHAQNKLNSLGEKINGAPEQRILDEQGNEQIIPAKEKQFASQDELAEHSYLTQNINNPESLAQAYGVRLKDDTTAPSIPNQEIKQEVASTPASGLLGIRPLAQTKDPVLADLSAIGAAKSVDEAVAAAEQVASSPDSSNLIKNTDQIAKAIFQVKPTEIAPTTNVASSVDTQAVEPAAVSATSIESAPAISVNQPAYINTAKAKQVEASSIPQGMKEGDIVTSKGIAFKDKLKAAIVKKEAGKGWVLKKVGEGYVVRYQPATEAQIAAGKARARAASSVDLAKDSMLTAIAKSGGIKTDELVKEWGVDLKGLNALSLGAGLKRAHHSQGKSADQMAELMAELGYIGVDEHGKHDTNAMMDQFFNELNGDPHYAPEGFENVAKKAQNDAYDDWLNEKSLEEARQAADAQKLSEQAQELIADLVGEFQDTTKADYEALDKELKQWEQSSYEQANLPEFDNGSVLPDGGRLAQEAGEFDTNPAGESRGNESADRAIESKGQDQSRVSGKGSESSRQEGLNLTFKDTEWESAIGNAEKKRYVAYDSKGKDVGFALIYKDANGAFDLSNIAVKDEYTRKGLATSLLDRVFIDTGAKQLSISTGTTGNGTALVAAYGEGKDKQGKRIILRPARLDKEGFNLSGLTEAESKAKAEKEAVAAQKVAEKKKLADQKAKADDEVGSFNLTGSDREADVAAANGQQDLLAQAQDPVEQTKEVLDAAGITGVDRTSTIAAVRRGDLTPSEVAEAHAPIGDFGEKLEGAKKDLWQDYQKSMSEPLPEDAKDIVLSKFFPEPDYENLIASGIDVRAIAAIKAMRDELPSKPKRPSRLKAWGEQVRALREIANAIINKQITYEQVYSKISGLRQFANKVELYAELGYPAFKSAKGYEITGGWTTPGKEGSQYALQSPNNRNVYFSSKEEALSALQNILAVAPENTAKKIKLDLYRITSTGDIVIGKKVASGKYIDLQTGFKSAKEAREYLNENESALLSKLEKLKEAPVIRKSVNDPRKGADYRLGEDVTPEKFAAEFGFRGVQFGNYVEQGRRVKDLNNAYDALLDLSHIINIPPRAVSLNGTLGLAFGARGTGGVDAAAAHYEPNQIVINLTKNNGFGSLGHEWFHAMDNYFGRASKQIGFITDVTNYTQVDPDNVRPESLEAFRSLIKGIKSSDFSKRSSKLDKTRSKDYWGTNLELAARAFESYLITKAQENGESNNYLANVIGEEAHAISNEIGGVEVPYAYPTKEEQKTLNPLFDKLFATLKTKKTDKGTALYSRRIHGDKLTSNDYVIPETKEFENNQNGDLAYSPFSAEKNGIEQLPIRLNVGVAREAHRGFGITHIYDSSKSSRARLPKESTGDLAEDFSRQSAHIAQIFDQIYTEGNRVIFRSSKEKLALVTQVREDRAAGDKYYSIITVVPSEREVWGVPDWVERKDFSTDRLLQSSVSVPSSDQNSQRSDRLLQRNQSSKFDFNMDESSNVKKNPSVTVKKRRTYTINEVKDDELNSKSPASLLNPHSSDTLRTALGKAFNPTFIGALEDTGKFKFITNDEAQSLLGDGAETQQSQDGRALGFFNPADQTTYLIPENIPATATPAQLKGLMTHEIGVHAIQLGKDSKEFKAILRDLGLQVKSGNKAAVAANQRAKDAGASPENLLEETLGYLSEDAPKSSIVQRLLAWFKQMVNKALGKAGKHWVYSTSDMRAMAQSALTRAPSLIGERNSKGTTLNSNQRSTWYKSQLADAIFQAPAKIDNSSGNNWSIWLTANASKFGVKKEEIEWSGVTDYLNLLGKEKVSKEQIAQFISDNGVKVDEVRLGNAEIYNEDNFDELPDDIRELVNEVDNGEIDEQSFGEMAYDLGYKVNYDRDGSVDTIQKIGAGSSEPTKYGKWTLPGGENYKELLITLPKTGGVKAVSASTDEHTWEVKMADGSTMTFSINKADDRAEAMDYAETKSGSTYKSSHWDTPNALAHIRMNDRTDAEGKKVLFVEEIQSDWHQAGRKKGYATPKGTLPKGHTVSQEMNADNQPVWVVRDEKGESVGFGNSKQQSIDGIISSKGAPDAPFKDTKAWTALALKRIISHAAENGYDKVAFVNGEQAADRFDLSKEINNLDIERDVDDSGAVKSFKLTAYDQEANQVINKTLFNLIDLEDHVGKDLASKIKDDFANNREHFHSYSGLDLKVGGEGMVNYYDKIVPQVANDVLKKIGGGKVENIDLSTEDSESKYTIDAEDIGAPETMEQEVIIRDKRTLDGVFTANSIKEAEDWLEKNDVNISAQFQPGFTITDTMRESAAKGLPLFSRTDNKKSQSFVVGSGLQLPSKQQQITNSSGRLLTDNHLVKYRAENGDSNTPLFSKAKKSEEVEPAEPTVTTIKSQIAKRIAHPVSMLKTPLNALGTATIPMSMSSKDAQVVATQFADNMRKSVWQWNKMDEYLQKEYTKDQLEKMWIAADQENDLRRDGIEDDTKGLASLSEKERADVELLHSYGNELLARAKASGMYEGEGVDYWTPRTVILIDENGGITTPKPVGMRDSSGEATNLRTKSKNTLHRKYATTAEAEAAAQGLAGEGQRAEILKDIRTMPMAMARLEQAISGRELVNQIKAIGQSTGESIVADGKQGDPEYFTINHPALTNTKVEMKEVPVSEDDLMERNYVVDQGKVWKLIGTSGRKELTGYKVDKEGNVTQRVPLLDENGEMIVNRTPLYIRKDFEGALKSVLNVRHGLSGVYSGLMSLKSKSMGLIMMSPLMHNAVEYGRAVPMMLTGGTAKNGVKNILTLGAYTYFVGNKAKNDNSLMLEAISHGLVPIGSRGIGVDLNGIADPASMEIGRSWTAKALGTGVDFIIGKESGDKVRMGVDAAGKFWHETLLWDRIGDLQMGLYQTMKTSLINKGVDEYAANTIAAHFANRYAGAIPLEAMSQSSREILNLALFSRSFTMGNLGAIKDMVKGLPSNRKSMIELGARELAKSMGKDEDQAGNDAVKQASAIGRKKAIATFLLDIAMFYVANSLLQDWFRRHNGDDDWKDQIAAYAHRAGKLKDKLLSDPLSVMLHPFDSIESLSSTSINAAGKEGRIRMGDDAYGNTIYMRLPFGKIGEEFVNYTTPAGAVQMLHNKLSPFMKPIMETYLNDKGVGQKVYDEKDPGFKQAGDVAVNFLKAQFPGDMLDSAINLAKGRGTPATLEQDQRKLLAPLLGVSFSMAKGGDTLQTAYALDRAFQDRKMKAMPKAMDALMDGDETKAFDILTEIGMGNREANNMINNMLDPARKETAALRKRVMKHATEEERDKLESLRR